MKKGRGKILTPENGGENLKKKKNSKNLKRQKSGEEKFA